MNSKIIAKTTVLITLIILISKFTGFLRDVTLAYAFGTSIYSDAFVLAQSVISVFSSLLFIALGIAFIPVYSKLKLNKNALYLHKFVNSLYSVIGIIIVFFGIIGILKTDSMVYLFAPGFSSAASEIAVTLTRILLPTILLSFISTIQGQQLRANNIFIPVACSALPTNIALIIAFLFITQIMGINYAGYAFVIGSIIQVVMLYPFTRKLGYHFHFNFDLKNTGLREILVLTLPILLGNTIQAINNIINKILASNLAEGSMAALNFSNKLALFIVGLVSLGAGTVCFTKMSELGARKEYDALKGFLRSIINLLNLFVVPATVGMMVLNVPIIKFVFEYGAFDSSSSEMTATALWFYSIGLVGFVQRDIITRAFYAVGDAKTPMINGGIAVGIGIAFNLILVRFMGIGGLALATSISGTVGTLLLLISLRKKLGQIGFKEISFTFMKTCASGAIMGVTVHLLYPVFYQATGILAVALLLDILCGIAVYGFMILFMRIREVDFVIGYLKRKFISHNKKKQSEC